MISVQNLLRLLNGNKYFWLLALGLSLLPACELLQNLPGTGSGQHKPDEKVIETEVDTVETPVDTIEIPGSDVVKNTYRIAVLLPFSIDNSYIDDFDYKDESASWHSLTATELYEGMLLALENTRRMKKGIEIYVYDTKNSAQAVREIMNMKTVRKSDVIIGPLFRNNLKTAAEIAHNNKTWLISPVIPVVELSASNPYLITANARLEAHLEQMAEYIARHYKHHRVWIIAPADENRQSYANNFRQLLEKQSRAYLDIKTTYFSVGDPLESDGLSFADSTIVMIPSIDEVFVNEVMRQLKSMATDHGIILFGMPTWITRFKSLRLDYLNDLHFHYTSSMYIDRDNKITEQLLQEYKDRYGMPASKYVVKGFDIMNWALMMLDKYGARLDKHFEDIPGSPFNTPFAIEPVREDNGLSGQFNVKYFENTYVHILRFSHFHPVKVNN